MGLNRSEIINIAIKKAETALEDWNKEIAKGIINRAMNLLVHQGHPAPIGWQMEIMGKIGWEQKMMIPTNIGNIADIDQTNMWMTINAMRAWKQWKWHTSNDIRH